MHHPPTGDASASKTGVGVRCAGPSSETSRMPVSRPPSTPGRLPTVSTQTRSTGTSGANTSTWSASARYHSCSGITGT